MDDVHQMRQRSDLLGGKISAWSKKARDTVEAYHLSVQETKGGEAKRADAAGASFAKEGNLVKRAMSGKNSWKKRYFKLVQRPLMSVDCAVMAGILDPHDIVASPQKTVDINRGHSLKPKHYEVG